MTVVDAGVIATALADDSAGGASVRELLQGSDLSAPELLDVEVASVLRRLVADDALSPQRARQALDDLIQLPLRRVRHRRLLSRCWELRENLTPYDAVYVALAEALDEVLLTADRRLARATGPRCRFQVLAV